MPLIGQEQKSCCAYIYMPDKTSVHDVASRTVRLMDSLLPPFLGRRLPTSGDALDLDRNRIDFSATTTVVLPVTDTVTQKSTIVHARAHMFNPPRCQSHRNCREECKLSIRPPTIFYEHSSNKSSNVSRRHAGKLPSETWQKRKQGPNDLRQ